MPSRAFIRGLIHLSRYKDYLFTVITITLFSLHFSETLLNRSVLYTLIILVLANLLSTCFTFMINDIEDAPDDALNPDKANRNPVSAGRITRRKASLATAVVGITGSLLYLYLGILPFLFGSLIVILGVFYSWRRIRLKNIVFIDIVSHSLMLGGFLYLASYTAFNPMLSFSLQLVVPFLLITAISAHGELYNELRDLRYDKLAGLKHTAVYIGEKRATLMRYMFLLLAAVNLLILLSHGLFPVPFIISFFVLLGIFTLPVYLSASTLYSMLEGDKFQEAIVSSGMLSMLFLLIYQLIPA